MDEMDVETIVSEQIETTKKRNIYAIVDENTGLNQKEKAEGKMTNTGISALRKAFESKAFHGKKAPATVEKVIPVKETYEEKVARLSKTYDSE